MGLVMDAVADNMVMAGASDCFAYEEEIICRDNIGWARDNNLPANASSNTDSV